MMSKKPIIGICLLLMGMLFAFLAVQEFVFVG